MSIMVQVSYASGQTVPNDFEIWLDDVAFIK
jgi:hypothetical protein